MTSLRLFSYFCFVMITISNLDPNLEEEMREILRKRFNSLKIIERDFLIEAYINALAVDLHEKGYTFTKYLGSGTYGVVLEATKADSSNKKIAVKLSHLDEETNECDQNQILVEQSAKVDTQVIRLIEQFKFESHIQLIPIQNENTIITVRKLTAGMTPPKDENGIEQLYNERVDFCLLALEGAEQDLSKPLFTQVDTDKAANAKVLGYVLYKLVKGFYTFNFIDYYLHADIKEANLVVVKSDEYKFEPKIIDFDLACKPSLDPEEDLACHGKVTYTLMYRPPELLFFCPDNNCKKASYGTVNLRKNYLYNYYFYSPEYKEDAWALGIAIKRILQINKEFIDSNDKFISFFKKNILLSILNVNCQQRMSTKGAYELLESFVQQPNWSFVPSKSSSIKPSGISLTKLDKIVTQDETPEKDSSSGSRTKKVMDYIPENKDLAYEFDLILNSPKVQARTAGLTSSSYLFGAKREPEGSPSVESESLIISPSQQRQPKIGAMKEIPEDVIRRRASIMALI